MPDLSITEDPFATDFELSRPIRTIVFADGEPVDFLKTPTVTKIPADLIALVESWGDQSKGFFGDRRPAWERSR